MAAALAAAVSVSVSAQDAGQLPDPVTDEIIVTARYRESTVHDLGMSVRAFDQEALNRLGIDGVGTLAQFTTSLGVQRRGPNRNDLNIRGISNLYVTRDLVPASRPVGLYLDESPVNTLGGAQFDVRMYDLERIEVLRGPQGTFYGEGSSGGAVRFFTRNPVLDRFEGNVEIEGVAVADGGNALNARAAVGIPLAKDRLGLRLVAVRDARPGWIDIVGGEEDANDLKSNMLRAVLLAEPSERIGIRAMFQYDDARVGSTGLYTGDAGARSASLPLDDDRIDDRTLVGNLRLEWRTDHGSLTALTSWFDRDRQRRVFDQFASLTTTTTTAPAFGIVDASFVDDTVDQRQFSQELRFVSAFEGPVQFTAGAFYRHVDFTLRGLDVCSDSMLLLGFPDRCQRAAFGSLGLPYPGVASEYRGKQFSAFADAAFSITERLTVSGGVRWHTEDIELDAPATTYLDGPAPVPLQPVSEEASIDVILPRFGIEWRIGADLLTYGEYSTGARNGGINPAPVLAAMEYVQPGSPEGMESYREDRTRNYELGVKSRFDGGNATLRAAAWYTTYDDLHAPIAVAPLRSILLINDGKAVSFGIEAELDWRLTENLDVFLGASWIEAELNERLITDRVTGASLRKGAQLPFSPEKTTSGGIEYRWPLRSGLTFYVTGNFSFSTYYWSGFTIEGDAVVDEMTLYGGGAGVRGESWSADFVVSNLTDRQTAVAVNPFDAYYESRSGPVPPGTTFNEQYMLQPRTFRLTLRYRF